MASGTAFPAYLKLEYQEGQGFAKFEAEANQTITGVKQRFDSGFREISGIITGALKRASDGATGLDFGAPQMRQSAAEARFQAEALKAVSSAAAELARLTGDTSQKTAAFVQSTRAAAIEADRFAEAAAREAQSLIKLEAASNVTIQNNERLRESYRALFAEQARAANAEVRVGNSQAAFNAGFAPGLDRSAPSARASAAVFEEAARAQEQLAQATAQLRAQLDPMIPIQQRFNAAMDQAEELYRQGAITAREFAAAQQLARDNLRSAAQQIAGTTAATEELNRAQGRGTTATRINSESLAGNRQAMAQVGQQLQDITVGFASGQQAAVVFAQQLPQLAFVMSDFGGKVGAVARFLAGPWGFAIFGAITAIGLFSESLFKSTDAANAAEEASRRLADRQVDLANFFDLATGAMKEQNQVLIQNAALKAEERVAEIDRERRTAGREARNLVRRSGEFVATGTETIIGPDGTPITQSTYQQSSALRDAIRRTDGSAEQIAAAARSVARAGGLAADEAAALSNLLAQDTLNARERRRLVARIRSFENGVLDPSLREPGRTRTRRTRDGSAAQFRRDEFGEDTRGRLESIAEQFDRTPPAIAQTERALRQLDDLITDINRKANPSEKAGLLAQVEETRRIVEGGIAARFEENLRIGEQDLEVQRLRLSGFEDQADVLARQFDLMRQFGAESADQLAIELNKRGITAEQYERMQQQLETARELTREAQRLDRAGASVAARLQAVDDIRSNIEQTFRELPDDVGGAIKGFFDRLRGQVNDLLARSITDSLFGDVFQELEREVANSPRARADRAVADSSNAVADKMRDLEAAAYDAASALRSVAANDNGTLGKVRSGFDTFRGRRFEDFVYDAFGLDTGGDIMVTASRGGPSGAQRATGGTDPINIIQLTFTRLFERFLGEGSPLAADLGGILKTGLQGAAIGQAAGGLIFGSKANSTASGIGGALGQIAGERLGQVFATSLGSLGQFAGPAGAIVGSILGNVVGSLLRKTRTGVANLSSGSGSLEIASFSGNSQRFREQAGQGGDSVIATIDRIAEALGATVGSGGAVSIGLRDGRYRVDPTGRGNTRTRRGAVDFGDDAEAAIRFATLDLIKDGVLAGLRASTTRLLQQAKDLDSGLQKALDFEGVFFRLKQYRDPVGAALDSLDKEFKRLIKIFGEAGASAEEYAQLEELYGIERAKAIKEAAESTISGLRALLNDLTVGNDALSLRTRIGQARTAYDPLAARVAAGDVTAYDDFANAARQLLDLQREYSGSTADYFALLDQVTSLTRARIDAESNVAAISAGRDSPFDSNGQPTNALSDNAAVVNAIEGQTAALLEGLSGFAAAVIRAAVLSGQNNNSVDPGFQTAASF